MVHGYAKNSVGDPRWITLRFSGSHCCKHNCGIELKKGERAFRYRDGTLYGDRCGHGHEAAADFGAHAADEEQMTGGREYGGQ